MKKSHVKVTTTLVKLRFLLRSLKVEVIVEHVKTMYWVIVEP